MLLKGNNMQEKDTQQCELGNSFPNGRRSVSLPVNSSTSTVHSGDENPDRGNWGGKVEFLLSCISYAVGLGNLWRFPYLCYRNGGGAFLIPYAIMLVFAGIPMFFLEISFGQFAGEGVITIWKVVPLMQGIGWGMFIVSSLIAMYYNMVIAWTLFYLFASINLKVPWRDCENHWNTPACKTLDKAHDINCTNHGGVWLAANHSCADVSATNEYHSSSVADFENSSTVLLSAVQEKSPADEYFHEFVLEISDGFHDMGGLRWQLVLCLMGAWTLVFFCLIKGIKSQGKVVYFTATFPYVVLCVLLVRGLTLPGSFDGILFYLTPQWDRLLTAKVWGDAAVQIFFSLSPCWGGLITLASYNKFHNDCMRDSLVVPICNCLTSFFAGFVIFGIIGFMAHEMNVDVDKVATGGAGLAFIIYPEVVSRLPVSPLWAIMFFMMLITLGMGTQFSVVCTVHTTLLDVFPASLRRGRRPTLLMVLLCIIGFMMGLICCTRGGMYMLQLIDNYAATYSLLIIGLCECLTLSYIYGVNNFLKDIEMMLGRKPGLWWKIMWSYVTPILLALIMLFTWIDYQPSDYNGYKFPVWADVLGWMMTMSSVVAIPVVMVYKICTAPKKDSLFETIKELCKPLPDWGPAIDHIPQNDMNKRHNTLIPLNLTPLGGGTPSVSGTLYTEANETDLDTQATLLHSISPRISLNPPVTLPVIYDDRTPHGACNGAPLALSKSAPEQSASQRI